MPKIILKVWHAICNTINMEAITTNIVTIKKTTTKNMKVTYNLMYGGHEYKLQFYHDGDDYYWFVSCFAIDGVKLDENMDLFY